MYKENSILSDGHNERYHLVAQNGYEEKDFFSSFIVQDAIL